MRHASRILQQTKVQAGTTQKPQPRRTLGTALTPPPAAVAAAGRPPLLAWALGPLPGMRESRAHATAISSTATALRDAHIRPAAASSLPAAGWHRSDALGAMTTPMCGRVGSDKRGRARACTVTCGHFKEVQSRRPRRPCFDAWRCRNDCGIAVSAARPADELLWSCQYREGSAAPTNFGVSHPPSLTPRNALEPSAVDLETLLQPPHLNWCSNHSW